MLSSIAREMRKYYVTLLIIDQRPSQIYDEVMSQLGTRISGWLGDEDDISAVLSGLAGRDSLRGILARLKPAEEVLMLGWGVPMPILVKSRRYDDQFWQDLPGSSGVKKIQQAINERIRLREKVTSRLVQLKSPTGCRQWLQMECGQGLPVIAFQAQVARQKFPA